MYIRESKWSIKAYFSWQIKLTYIYTLIFFLMNNHYKTSKSCISNSSLVGIVYTLNIIIVLFYTMKKRV